MPSFLEALSRETWLEGAVMSKMANVETGIHARMRGESFPRCLFALVSTAASVLAVLVLLFRTGVWTVKEASEICDERMEVLFSKIVDDFQRDFLETSATHQLYPTYLISQLPALFFALAGMLLWLFFSPHRNFKEATQLDKTLGSFFGVGYLACLFSIVSGPITACTSSTTTNAVSEFIVVNATVGVSVVGTNLLSHRYLLERASFMSKISGDSEETQKGWFSLENLKTSFIWEIRSFAAAGILTVINLVDLRTALACFAGVFGFILATDALFSVVVTYIFLKPMLEVLQASGRQKSTVASRRLQRTKRWNLVGVVITVGSSTLLYVNMVVYVLLTFFRDFSFNKSNFLNPFAFGCTLDSILNTIGMILLSGMFKDVSFRGLLSSVVPTTKAMSSRYKSSLKVKPLEEKAAKPVADRIVDSSACEYD